MRIFSRKRLIIFVVVFIPASLLGYFIIFYRLGGDVPSSSYRCPDCNLVMISLSNISADHMSLYGYERLTTPKLAACAKNAIVFTNAFTQSSWTLPVATSLFTSLYPYSHNVVERHFENALDAEIQTLPELLRDAGYRTAAFTGGLDYDQKFDHMRGFEMAEEATSSLVAITFAGFEQTLQKGLGWIQENQKRKFFLFLHGYDAHCPFDPPKQFLGMFSGVRREGVTVDNTQCLRGFKNSESGTYRGSYFKKEEKEITLTEDDIEYLEDLYDEEIASVDALIGNFLEKLDAPMRKKTIVVIFSDHGEMFAKHGRFGRAGAVRGTLYDDVVHVPLVISAPGLGGKTVGGLVQLIDVMPTLLDILGLSLSRHAMQGKNLMPLLAGDVERVNAFVFAGSKFGHREESRAFALYPVQSINESVRNQEWKLIHEIKFNEKGIVKEDAYELYDLMRDPDELQNAVSSQPATAETLKAVLEGWKATTGFYNQQDAAPAKPLPPDILENARERGYW